MKYIKEKFYYQRDETWEIIFFNKKVTPNDYVYQIYRRTFSSSKWVTIADAFFVDPDEEREATHQEILLFKETFLKEYGKTYLPKELSFKSSLYEIY